MSIDEIQGVEYDPQTVDESNKDSETVDEINNDNVESFEDTMDDLSVETPDPEEDDLRRNIISDISVPDTGR